MITDASARLPFPYRPEAGVVAEALAALHEHLDWGAVVAVARPWVDAVRGTPAPFWAMESLLHEYPISSAEGLALMRLAEALLRVPDAETAVLLTADQLGRADFDAGAGGDGPHRLLAGLSAGAIALSKRLLPGHESGAAAAASTAAGMVQRLGARTVVAATVRALQLLGRQFVLGRSIGEATATAATQRRAQPRLRFSYDMLGEGARTDADALRYLAAYRDAIAAIAAMQATTASAGAGAGEAAAPQTGDGISVKLSALFARYEDGQRARVADVLLPRARSLVEAAARANLNLTIDAEESDRLELSLDVFEALAARAATAHPGWQGFGLAVQAYSTRSLAVVDAVADIARRHALRLMVRLVKGAYWDGEIKRAQEGGLPGYPVFTRKAHTDVAYLACAQRLIAQRSLLYPQFATHNAGTIAAILQMLRRAGAAAGSFEFQRLHGMGSGVYREVLRDPGVACRVYAPVGEHRDLLAYLVRRLLENGANSSFVHQLADERVGTEALLASPLEQAGGSAFPSAHDGGSPFTPANAGVSPRPPAHAGGSLPGRAADSPFTPAHAGGDPFAPAHGALVGVRSHAGAAAALPLPTALYGAARSNSAGVDLACAAMREPLLAAVSACAAAGLPDVATDDAASAAAAMSRLHAGAAAWRATPLAERAAVLRRAADLLQSRMPAHVALLVVEAGKTLGDAVGEVREAIDFCRYYAAQAQAGLDDVPLPGPTGERNVLRLRGRGVFVCISPWNFPLAIFAGQVAAALVAGNAVAAKPAEQTPRVAQACVALLHEAGVPAGALALVNGPGETVGAALVADVHAAGVCFTGSTAVARSINRALAAKDGPIVPLIAETGGRNAMVVDSTALPEQVVDAVVQSAFRSAGQRCSALRLLCLHEAVADGLIAMLKGAMAELVVGDPADLATDVGPLIDDEAHAAVAAQVERLRSTAVWLGESPVAVQRPRLLAPVMFEIASVADLRQEIFGPVLHVVRWRGDVDALVAAIDALGYGLTLGVQTRIDTRAQRIADVAHVGNVYVNRNMIGAVVGVQPFGGEGLSGTGPKAGGPNYLLRFVAEQTLTVNTAAAGGNVELLGGSVPAAA